MLPINESGALWWSIALGMGTGVAVLGLFWFKQTDMVRNPWLIRVIGVAWISLLAAIFWIIFPEWRWMALIIFTVGNIWALYVASPQIQRWGAKMTQGWQWPFRSPRKPKINPITLGIQHIHPSGVGITRPDWLVEVVQEDRQKFPNLIKVIHPYQSDWIWGGVSKSEPFIEVIVELANLSIFDVDLSDIKDSLTINGTPCNATAKCAKRRVLHGEPNGGRVRIHQPITPQTAQAIASAANSNTAIKVRLSSCFWIVTPEDPEGIAQSFRLLAGGEYDVTPKL